ncbi:glycosyltransferase family 25 protein [Tatumella sp. UBA2305]|uniref:glycosyltransferase family 25 protein n=1 Tax=Tatumella sp. UBA2305 TaxID=1947647 RepID=UPI0025FC7EF9|nr:glycosyltransferase family 25 protein [Tatumella sp. UBA2305]
MKTFVINLPREVEKKQHITDECERVGLDVEIYNAVDGSSLSEDFLRENVFDYENSFLTKGEIGCSLSHINLYKRIIDENLPFALIMEDDATFGNELVRFVSEFDNSTYVKDGIYLLTGDVSYVENRRETLSEFNIYPVRSAIRTTGYIITHSAAKAMLKLLHPVRFEADMYEVFKKLSGVRIYATIPHIISTNDKDKSKSSIQAERSLLVEKRDHYRGMVFKKMKREMKFSLKVSDIFWRVFIRKFERVKRYTQY